MLRRIVWILGALAGLGVGPRAMAAGAAAPAVLTPAAAAPAAATPGVVAPPAAAPIAASAPVPANQPDSAVAQQGGALLDRMMPSAFKALWLENTGGVASLHTCEAYVSPAALQAWPGLIDYPYTTQPAAIVAYLPSDTPYGQDVFQAVRQNDGKWKVTRASGAVASAAPSPAGLETLIQSCLAHFGAIAPGLVYPTVYPPDIWPPAPRRLTQAAAG